MSMSAASVAYNKAKAEVRVEQGLPPSLPTKGSMHKGKAKPASEPNKGGRKRSADQRRDDDNNGDEPTAKLKKTKHDNSINAGHNVAEKMEDAASAVKTEPSEDASLEDCA
ncbi:MAG: hypothetical protein Q9162_001204 [Coniocarpon cinnabarinum]